MPVADPEAYLCDLIADLKLRWPDNHTVNIVCHGHSVVAGYFADCNVETFKSYPHLLHRDLNTCFPTAVINVVVTAIGGEESPRGAARFDAEVACHQPRLLTIDYGLNDRRPGLAAAETAWRSMIEKSLDQGIKLILLTPTADNSRAIGNDEQWKSLLLHADQIRRLASEYEVGLADSLAEYERHVDAGGAVDDLLSTYNHPNLKGHQIVARELLKWFVQ